MSLERILEEEKELEKLMYETPAEEVTPIQSDVVADEDEIVEPTETTEVISQETPEETQERKQRQSWKARFVGYKASTDKTISNLRKDNSNLIARLNESNAEVNKLSSRISNLLNKDVDIFEGSITPGDVDVIGVEAVDVVKRATKKATESAMGPIREELERLKAKDLKRQEEDRNARTQATYNVFLKDLANLVPNYAELNVDEGFKKYMEDYDSSTGEKRVDIFRRAEEFHDADRVADFFLEYKESVPKSKKTVLEDKVTPNSNNASSVPLSGDNLQESFTAKQVERFYNDLTKGVYKNRLKEAEDIETRITKAYLNGNISE